MDDDRTTYDTYLKLVKAGERFDSVGKLLDSIYQFSTSLAKMPKLIMSLKLKVFDIANLGNELYHSFKDGAQFASAIDHFLNAWSNAEYPEMVIPALEKSLALEDYNDKVKIDDLIDVSINTADFVNQLNSASKTELDADFFTDPFWDGVRFLGKVSKDFFDRVRWTALIQYNNIRVSKRMMRYFGMDW